jgi:ABC-type transport system involved in multi-copper enzyme maturation permease subunit
MNPMIRKELRQRMRERRGWILPSLYLLTLSAVITVAYYTTAWEGAERVQGWQIGEALFLTLAYTQLVLLLLLAPIFSAGALTIEKEQRTLGGLLTSLLRPTQIWWGKFAASLMFVLLLLIIGMPVLSAVFAFGGVGPWEITMVALTTVIILGTISAISLYWSSAFRRSVHATAVSYVSVVAMTVVTFIIFGIALSRHRAHVGYGSWDSIPAVVKAPLYVNPVFFVTVCLVPRGELYPEWFICLAVFVAISALSAVLTLRNLRRSGELA